MIEILLVVTIIAILAATAVPLFQSNLIDQLENAGQIVLGDLERARQLAVSNNSQYKLVFSSDNSGYYLEHSGTNSALDTLPSWPYRLASDPADRQTTQLSRMPGLTDTVVIGFVEVVSGTPQAVVDVEFNSLGATTRSNSTEVHLAAGSGTSRRYLTIKVNPITGLAEMGDVTALQPLRTSSTEDPVDNSGEGSGDGGGDSSGEGSGDGGSDSSGEGSSGGEGD